MKKTRLLVLPNNYDINFILSNIKIIEVVKKD